MKLKVRRILWGKWKDRPKSAWLKRGFRDLGFFVKECGAWSRRWGRLPGNHLGPYVYPFKIEFDGIPPALVLFDSYPNPDKFFLQLRKDPKAFYFKTHIRKQDLDPGKRIFIMPNSAGRMEYLRLLERGREIADRRIQDPSSILIDIYGIMWADDDGTRLRAVKLLEDSGEFRTLLGVHSLKQEAVTAEKYFKKKIPYQNHIEQAGGSRLSLALPGGASLPFCSFRHVEGWGIGAVVFSHEPDCALPGDPDPAEIMFIFRKDLSDLVERVRYAIERPDFCSEIARKGRAYYEEQLSPPSHARHVLKLITSHIGGSG